MAMTVPAKYAKDLRLREELDPGQELSDAEYEALLAKCYNTRQHAIARCHNPNNKRFKKYGDRGIVVCPKWRHKTRGFYNFLRDMGLPPGTGLEWSIERQDVDKGYGPDNCCWLDQKGQANNRTNNTQMNFLGEVKSLSEWAEDVGIPAKVVSRRINKGWSTSDALLTPYRGGTGI